MREFSFNGIKIFFITMLLFVFIGCGSEIPSSNDKIGYLIDAPIAGVNYECGDIKGVTDINGAFKCTKMPVTFKLGGMTIGVLSEFTTDGNVYLQDILGIARDDYDNEKLVKLARFLQSLDDDGNISTHIYISQNLSQNYQSNHNFDSLTLENLVLLSDKELVSKESAIAHLKSNVESKKYFTQKILSKYHEVLGLSLKFYEAQRGVGPFESVSWRKPASTTDGADVGVDLNGGWFDAGDHVKFNLPMSYSVGMLNWSMINDSVAYEDAQKLSYGKSQAKYALDYLLNTYQAGSNLNSPSDDKIYFQVANGHTDHSFWGPPEELTMSRPTFTCDSNGGCAAVAGSMVGAFASGAILFKDDAIYSQKLLDSAKRLYNFSIAYPTDDDYSNAGQDFYKLYSNNKDQLAWGAIWLYKATNDSTYLAKAKELMANEYPWGQAWDNMILGVSLLLYEQGESSYKQRIETELNSWITATNGISKSAGGLRVRDGIKWGNLRYSSTMAYMALLYRDMISDSTQKEQLLTFAKSQIDYILGANPNKFSYVVGYGDKYPLKVHHRGASGTKNIADSNPNRYVIDGALVGGPMSANDNDYQDVRDGEIGWTANEVATDYNAGFTGALAKLAMISNGDNSSFVNVSNSTTPTNTSIINNSSSSSSTTNDSTTTPNSSGTTATNSNPSTNLTGSCSVNYKIRDSWNNGATIDVVVTNNLATLSGWEVAFSFANNQTINNLWNGSYSQNLNNVKVKSQNYNANVVQGAKIEFGFNINHNGVNQIPTEIRLNNTSCSIENISGTQSNNTTTTNNTSTNNSTPFNNPLFTQFNVGIGGAGSFPFASSIPNETIWVNSVDLMLDSNIANNNYYKNIKSFDYQKFTSLQQYLKNSKFLVLWLVEGWQESWFDIAKIQSAMDRGVVPVFNYWYFGDKLMDGLDETKKAKYKEDYARLSTFLNKLNGTKILIMEPEFNKQNITATAQSQHEFASVIGEAIDSIKAKTTNVLFSLAMMDTGSRNLNQTSAECGYANCALGDKYEWGLSEIVYNDLINKLDFISFQQMVGQFSRNPQNAGGWDTPNPIAYSDSQIGIDVLADRINNMAKFLKDKYNKPIFLPYIAIATASWGDTDGDNQIDSIEVIKDGWESKANGVYQKLSTMRETLLANGLFGFAPMELFDNPRHDYNGYQYFMNNEYHLGIIASGALDVQDIASYGDLKFKGSILDYIYLTPVMQTNNACSVHYNIRNSWNNGATIDVTLTNKMTSLNGWQVTFNFTNGQSIYDLWNGIYSQAGSSVKVNNKDYNGVVSQGGSVEFGFNLSHNGTNTIPAEIRLNGNICEKL
ncbi:MAG: glycoside hydrolase family 9 protein [Epsilonproteobacteria bacterium]|nr:glycoside hydrolase family 9 protein [Campylobacterota bacterium]